MTCKRKLYKTNSGKDQKQKDCWDYTGMFDFLYRRKGEKRKRNMSMRKFASTGMC